MAVFLADDSSLYCTSIKHMDAAAHAINNHDALVAALKELTKYYDALKAHGHCPAPDADILANAKEALKQAGEL